jgi:putative membrane protein insertion efficiency factor
VSEDPAASPEPSADDIEIRRVGPVSWVLLWLVRQYQRFVSPALVVLFGPYSGCRFAPTCSHYALGAIREHGALRGVALGLWRILRCSPFSKGGLDPVPRKRRAAPSCVRG